VNKESGLAHDENTRVPQDDQMQPDSATENTTEITEAVEVQTIADETAQTTV
jgi:hypothetical protein